MGKRGCLHDDARRIVRPVVGGYRAWVTCATALAAGHRPCGECRRANYRRFKHAWTIGNPEHGISSSARIGFIDLELHRDRLGQDRCPRTHRADIGQLPDGTFVAGAERDSAALVWRDSLWAWSPEGYSRTGSRPPRGQVTVLTPRSTVNAIAAGYIPMVHATADT